MDLEHHTWFINEVMADSQICIYARMVARSAKMIHYLMFMVDESTGKVAAHFECVNALVDLQARKTTPYPAEILTRIDTMLAEQSQLAWRRRLAARCASGSRKSAADHYEAKGRALEAPCPFGKCEKAEILPWRGNRSG